MWNTPARIPVAITMSNSSGTTRRKIIPTRYRLVGGGWTYDPKCNVGFLDGHVNFMKLGPYEPFLLALNTENYIIDPDYWP